jgi:hypothetical protein
VRTPKIISKVVAIIWTRNLAITDNSRQSSIIPKTNINKELRIIPKISKDNTLRRKKMINETIRKEMPMPIPPIRGISCNFKILYFDAILLNSNINKTLNIKLAITTKR